MPTEAIIEVSIPMRYLDRETDDVDCAICAHPMCPDDSCCLAATHLSCCNQPMCCSCFGKLLARCRCSDECTAIVGTCPFCREMCRAEAVAIFLARKQPCRGCKKI